MTARPSAWTTPPTDYEREPGSGTGGDRSARSYEDYRNAIASPPVFRKLPDGTLVVAVRRPGPAPKVGMTSEAWHGIKVALGLTAFIAAMGFFAAYRIFWS